MRNLLNKAQTDKKKHRCVKNFSKKSAVFKYKIHEFLTLLLNLFLFNQLKIAIFGCCYLLGAYPYINLCIGKKPLADILSDAKQIKTKIASQLILG